MSSCDGRIIGHEEKVEFRSDILTIKFFRHELGDNPILWNPNFEGEKCKVEIFHDIDVESAQQGDAPEPASPAR
jgi:hypothetical protein